MNYISSRIHGIIARTKLFAALRFYAAGSYYSVIGDFVGISLQTLPNIILEVSKSIARLRPKYIFMPKDQDEKLRNLTGFIEIGGFPNVIGT